jgi:4-amino-4-deoxychorismate lyase
MSALLAASVNGNACHDPEVVCSLLDRALHYGDGLFETMLIARGKVVEFDRHHARLLQGCRLLGIDPPESARLVMEAEGIVGGRSDAILKLIVSRPHGGRGYRGPENGEGRSIFLLYEHSPTPGPRPAIVRWCTTRMARNATLAGIKHLNRLEQVLAQREWWDASIDEGLMLDTEGEVISGTASNVFLVANGALCTPDLRYCGVHGTMRARVLEKARELNLQVIERGLWPEDFEDATEAFVTNAIRGIRPVVQLGDRRWKPGPYARDLAMSLEI